MTQPGGVAYRGRCADVPVSEGDSMNFDRITVEPEKLEGKPSVRGLRITVETVVRLVAAGWTFDEILPEYPEGQGPRRIP